MSTPDHNPKRSSARIIPAVVTIVGVVGIVGAFFLTRSVGSDVRAGQQPTFRVKRGPLTISVAQSGTIKSLEQVSLKCEVEGQTTIIYLIPEGTQVQEGDLLVELDGSRLQDDLTQQQISVDSAEAGYIRARENLAVVKNQSESDISRAELDLQFAEEDVKQYVEGLYPQETKEAESNITLANEEWERAKEKLKWSERLFEEKYISQTELEADQLTCERAKLNYELAVSSSQLLKEYTSQRKLTELKSNVDQAKLALERVKLKANADIVQAEADLKAAETQRDQQLVKLEKIKNQLSKTKIFAPRDGLAVYATSVQTGGRRWRDEPLQEGQGVRERQELIYLPSAKSMMAEVQIHESALEKVKLGQSVRVTVDALPGQAYTGRVAKIAPLPDASSAWLNPDLKVYPTEIHLDGVNPDLRTGMSCRAEIIVEYHPDAVFVPVQAVVRVGADPTVFIQNGGGYTPQTVKIGLDNNAMVHVLAGLEPGNEVLLTPPLDTRKEGAEGDDDAGPSDAALAESGRARAGANGEAGARGGPPTAGPGGASAEAVPRGSEGGPPGAPEVSADQREQMRQRFQNLTPEQREEMRKQFENMTPEQREELRQRMQGGGRGGRDRGDRTDGSRRRDRQRPESGADDRTERRRERPESADDAQQSAPDSSKAEPAPATDGGGG